MNIIKFVELELNVKLSHFQKDLLIVLQTNPEGWLHAVKPHTHDVAQVLTVYNEWRKSMLVAV